MLISIKKTIYSKPLYNDREILILIHGGQILSRQFRYSFYTTFTFVILLKSTALFALDEKNPDRFWDSVGKRYVYSCSTENDIENVAESCGKFWKTTPRKRTELLKMVDEYQGIKKDSYVMALKKRDGKDVWFMGPVSQFYEDGSVQILEYYGGRGYNPGTQTNTSRFDQLSLPIDEVSALDLRAGMDLCAKEKFEVGQGFQSEKFYKFEKNEKVKLVNIFSNGYGGVRYYGTLMNIVGYGTNNLLPVLLEKFEKCETEVKLPCP